MLHVLSDGGRPNAIFPTVFSTAELRVIRVPALLLIGDNERILRFLQPGGFPQRIPAAEELA